VTKFNTQYLIQSIKCIPRNELTSYEVCLLCALISYGNVQNKIPVPQNMLADFIRSSVNTANKYILSLVQKGFISYTAPIHYTHKSCNVYSLNLDKIYQFNPYKSPSNESDIALNSRSSRPQMKSKSPSPRGNLDCNRQSTEGSSAALPTAAACSPEEEKNQNQEPEREPTNEETLIKIAENLGITVERLKADIEAKKSPKRNV